MYVENNDYEIRRKYQDNLRQIEQFKTEYYQWESKLTVIKNSVLNIQQTNEFSQNVVGWERNQQLRNELKALTQRYQSMVEENARLQIRRIQSKQPTKSIIQTSQPFNSSVYQSRSRYEAPTTTYVQTE